MKSILVAMDSMKGCLDSYHASLWVAAGVQDAFPDAEVRFRPVSDGGEGMSDMVSYSTHKTERIEMVVSGSLGKNVTAEAIKTGSCVYLDFASAAGLTLVEEKKRNPMDTTSYGVGQMINKMIKSGISDIRIGLGGSGTVDAGLGALQALGLRLLDEKGCELSRPFKGGMLADVADIELTEDFKRKISNLKLTLFCDVEAPFTGIEGAARVFGPQKGADETEVDILEKGMERIRMLVLDKTGIDLNSKPGSGAAGGAAGGLMALVGGEIKRGASALLDLTDFDADIEGADLIITGEGGSDRQTLMGKIPYEILLRGMHRNIPVWLVAGRIRDKEALLDAGFEKIICINSPDIVQRSGTLGMNPMDPAVAEKRLSSIVINDEL